MATRAQLLDALKKADAAAEAGDESAAEDARKIAAILKTKTDDAPSFASSLGKAAVRGVTSMVDAATTPFTFSEDIARQITGATSRQTATDLAADAGVTYRDLEELPRTHRPAAVAAETFVGSMVPGGVAVQGLRSATAVPKVLQGAANLAKRSPAAFLAGEAASAAGAAQGGAIAEVLAPGNPWARAGAEVTGGFVAPASIPGRLYRGVKRVMGTKTAQDALPALTNAKATERASEIVHRVIQESGEDPQAIIKALEGADPNSVALSSANKTGSQALLNLEAKLASDRPQVGVVIDEQKNVALQTMRETMDALAATGKPEALRAAAVIRQRYVAEVLNARMQRAQAEAQAARSAVGSGGRAGQAEASRRAAQAVDEAWDDARSVERELWGQVPNDAAAGVENAAAAFKRAKGEMLPTSRLPAEIENFFSLVTKKGDDAVTIEYPDGSVRTMGQGPYNPTTGDLKNLRSDALDLAQEARASGRFKEARLLGMVAAGALEDMAKLDIPALEPARDYSRAMHDAFTRTFARDVMRETPEGAERIAGDLALERGFGAGGTGGDVRLRELRGAAEFPEGARAQTGPAMRSAQEDFLRATASRLADPQTGAIPPGRMQKFLDDNATTLQNFPRLRDELASSVRSEQRLGDATASAATRMSKAERTFSRVLKAENPSEAVGRVLVGSNPAREYLGLARLARKSGREATEGLKSATLRDAMNRATSNGELSFSKLHDELTGGNKSVLDLMLQARVIDNESANRLRQLTMRAAKIEKNIGDPKALEDLVGAPDALLDVVARIAGAKIGGTLSKLSPGGGGGLIPTAAGSRHARNWMSKVPIAKVTDVLIEAAKDPKVMAALLRKTKTPAEKAQVERQLNGFLINAGVVASTTEDEE